MVHLAIYCVIMLSCPLCTFLVFNPHVLHTLRFHADIVESYMPDDSPEPALCFNAWEAALVGLTPDGCSNLGAAGTLVDGTLREVVATALPPTRLQANGVAGAAQEAAESADDSAQQQDQGRDRPVWFHIDC